MTAICSAGEIECLFLMRELMLSQSKLYTRIYFHIERPRIALQSIFEKKRHVVKLWH